MYFLIQLQRKVDEFYWHCVGLLVTLLRTSEVVLSGGRVIGDLTLSQHFLPQLELRSPEEINSTPPLISRQQS